MEMVKKTIDQLFATCRHMPDDEEVMPAIGELLETEEHAYSAEAEAIDVEAMGTWVAAACKAGATAKIDLAGLLSLARRYTAYGDSVGGFAYERSHRTDFHVTATDDNGSGWAEDQGVSINQQAVMQATRRAIDKCAKAQNPQIFDPRPTTVILEPQAVGDLLGMAFWYGFDQRSKDEGRSAFSSFEESLGELSFYSDPANKKFPTLSFNQEGQALGKNTWLDKGQLQQLQTSRFWANKNGLAVKPVPHNIILSGAGIPVEELVKDTRDGILVTRFWYIRSTDPKTLGFTGLTRDGTYRIEDGEVTSPVVDMRWNDSVLRVLNNVVASGEPVATGEFISMVMPALKIEDFHFTSLSN